MREQTFSVPEQDVAVREQPCLRYYSLGLRDYSTAPRVYSSDLPYYWLRRRLNGHLSTNYCLALDDYLSLAPMNKSSSRLHKS